MNLSNHVDLMRTGWIVSHTLQQFVTASPWREVQDAALN